MTRGAQSLAPGVLELAAALTAVLSAGKTAKPREGSLDLVAHNDLPGKLRAHALEAARTGELAASRIGRTVWFRTADIDAWITRHRIGENAERTIPAVTEESSVRGELEAAFGVTPAREIRSAKQKARAR